MVIGVGPPREGVQATICTSNKGWFFWGQTETRGEVRVVPCAGENKRKGKNKNRIPWGSRIGRGGRTSQNNGPKGKKES